MENTDWSLVELNGQKVTTEPGKRPPSLKLDADGKRAGGFGGCNQFGGGYELEGTNLRFGDLISTLMACMENGVMEREQAYHEALRATTRYEVSGGALTLYAGDRAVARFEAR